MLNFVQDDAFVVKERLSGFVVALERLPTEYQNRVVDRDQKAEPTHT